MNISEINETKQQLRACIDENLLVQLVHTYEQILNAPVHVEITVSVLDPENQPRQGGFRRKDWHDGKPIQVDTPGYHFEFPPIQAGTTIVHGEYRDDLEKGLTQCFDVEKAATLLKRIEEGRRPAELELRAYSLFLIDSEGVHSASPVTLGRIRLGQLNAREISVTRIEEADTFKQEAEMLVGQYNSVAHLDQAIQEGNVLFSAIAESPEAAVLLDDIQRELGLSPRQVKEIHRICDLVREEEKSAEITVGQALRSFLSLFTRNSHLGVAQAVREYIVIKKVRHFNWPVQRSGTTIYVGQLREDLHTKIRIRRPAPIAHINVDFL